MDYNSNATNEYLSTLNLSKNQMRVKTILFKKFHTIEEDYQTNLYNLPHEAVIRELFDRFDFSRLSTLRQYVVEVNNYKTWALMNDLVDDDVVGSSGQITLDNEFIHECYKKNLEKIVITSPQKLIEILDTILLEAYKDVSEAPEGSITLDGLLYLVMLLLYHGIDFDDLLNFKRKEVQIINDKTVIIVHNKKMWYVRDYALVLFLKYYEASTLLFKTRWRYEEKKLSDEEYFINGRSGLSRETTAKRIKLNIAAKYKVNKGDLDVGRLSVYNVTLFGKLYNIKEKELLSSEKIANQRTLVRLLGLNGEDKNSDIRKSVYDYYLMY